MAKRPSSPETQAPAQDAPASEVVANTAKRLPFAQAKEANFGKKADPDALQGAGVVLTAKGTNMAKQRVYGYDTDTGKVPTGAVIAIVPGAGCPKGVPEAQWAALQEWAGKTVQAAYDSQKVASRTVRRAYRGGAIRFLNA